jgi:hypothetical protein
VSDQHLQTRLEALAAGPPTPDWGDALRRAQNLRRQRSRLTIAFAALAAVIVAAPTFALATDVIDFGSADPAPEPFKQLFGELNTGAPPGMTPGVDAKDTRAVLRRELFGRPHTLWVAPRKGGGFCLFLLGPRGGGGGGCVDPGVPLSPGVIRPDDQSPFGAHGSVAAPGATHVEVIHTDGSSTRTELVWVSAPIDAAFFVLEVPADLGIKGFVARDADGKELARRMLPPGALGERP